MKPHYLGLGAGILTGVAWGGTFPIMPGLLRVLDPYWFTTIRYLGASAVLLLLLFLIEGKNAFRFQGRGWTLALLGACSIAGFNLLVLEGVRMAGPEHGGLIVALSPLFAALLLWLRNGTKPRPITLSMIALAFAGVALVITKGDAASVLHGGSGIGDLLIALGVLSMTVYQVGSAEFRDWTPLRFTTLSVAFGTAITVAITALAIAAGFSHPPSIALDTAFTGGMLYMILIGAVFAYLMWNFAVTRIGPQRAVLFMNLIPIVTFAIELALGERFAAVEYAGAAITVLALVLNNVATGARLAPATPVRAVESSRACVSVQ